MKHPDKSFATMTPTLRPPAPADYEAIASWVPNAEACARWAGARMPFPFSATELPSLLAIAGAESYCLAEGAGSPLAFGQHWVLVPGAVHLGRIMVSPTVRGQGLGRRLCQLLFTQAVQATGATAVTLRVYRDNAAALALYSSLGFVPMESESDDEVMFMRTEVSASV